jgi:hypothetical protein
MAAPLLALLAAVLMVWAGVAGRGKPIVAAQEAPDSQGQFTVGIPAAHRRQIDSWPKFFVCYGLVQDAQVIVGTLRANDYPNTAFPAGGEVNVVLRAAPGAFSAAEKTVIAEARTLLDQRQLGRSSCPR